MELLSVIRRWAFSRRSSRSGRSSGGRACRGTRSANICGRDAVEPQFKVPDRPSKLDPFAEKLSGWLRQEAGKSRKQKRTRKQIACGPGRAWI